MKSVVVFGATGYTGRLVVEALLDLGVSNVVLGGRDEQKLRELSEKSRGLDFRVADALHPETLAALVEGAHVVISTAGPFSLYGEPVVRAALATGAHFLDTTGEQSYMARILERYHGLAKGKGLAVVNAQAYEFAFGYCASALLAEWDPAIHTIDVFNRVYGFGASRGTQKSALEQVTASALVRRNGRLVERGLSPVPKPVTWPDGKRELAVPFPGGEALHMARLHPQVKNVTTNLALPARIAAPLMAAWSARPFWRALSKTGAFDVARRLIDSGSEGPEASSRKTAGFRTLARGQSDVLTRAVMITGRDAYGITGVVAALGAKLLMAAEPRMAGVVSTDQAFGARDFLDLLAPYGVAVSKHDL